MTFDDYSSFPSLDLRKKKKSLLHFCSFSIIQRVNFTGSLSLSLSLKKRNPKTTPKKKNITQSHAHHFCTHADTKKNHHGRTESVGERGVSKKAILPARSTSFARDRCRKELSRITTFCTPTEARRGCVVVVVVKVFFLFIVLKSFRFWRERFFFGRRRRRQSLSLCCASKRVDRNVCRGSVVSVGLDAFIRGDTNLLSVRVVVVVHAKKEKKKKKKTFRKDEKLFLLLPKRSRRVFFQQERRRQRRRRKEKRL